ncbi:MAG: ribose-phosphate pyrophosphokinase [Myxococcales bacterium]|jgi:ribose-phosphate pyrophosphokinase|nr:ribose-phosphate pyrophosphokinase [Myxococcales bacterium]
MEGRLKVFAGASHPRLAEDICYLLDIPLGRSRSVKFSNENLLIQIEENVRECDVFVIQTSAPPVNEGIIETLIMIDALKHASAARVTAVLPYFPYARSDKKDKPRISITARLMADLLMTAGADRVLTMDLHSPQIQGFFRIPVDQLKAVRMICDFYQQRDLTDYVLVAGDAGEAKELGSYANRLNLPMAIVDKRRYGDDEKPRAVNVIGDVEGKRCLIVDDEVASGGTLIEAAQFLMKRGARSVEATCVHPVLSGNAVSRITESAIEELVVTDSIPVADRHFDKLKVLPTAPLFAKAIRRIHEGDSVSELFG